MYKTVLTIGLFDKDTESQIISTNEAKTIISKTLIDDADLFAFTMIDCQGVYKMNSSGNIVSEPSIRIEIVTDNELNTINLIIAYLKIRLNQESIMLESSEANVNFI